MEAQNGPYLLTRQEAAERYRISVKQLERVYRRNRDFPVVRVGRTVLIHRDRADSWFTESIGTVIDA